MNAVKDWHLLQMRQHEELEIGVLAKHLLDLADPEKREEHAHDNSHRPGRIEGESRYNLIQRRADPFKIIAALNVSCGRLRVMVIRSLIFVRSLVRALESKCGGVETIFRRVICHEQYDHHLNRGCCPSPRPRCRNCRYDLFS